MPFKNWPAASLVRVVLPSWQFCKWAMLFLCYRWRPRYSLQGKAYPRLELKPSFKNCPHFTTLYLQERSGFKISFVISAPAHLGRKQACHVYLYYFNSCSHSETLTVGNDWKWPVEIDFNTAPRNQWLLWIWTVKSLLIQNWKCSCWKSPNGEHSIVSLQRGLQTSLIWLHEQ